VQRRATNPARYPVVLFDLDNTLSDFTAAQREALPGLLGDHGVENGAEYLDTFRALATPLWHQLEAGELTLATLNDERFRRLIEHTDLDLDPSVLAPEYLAWLSTSGDLIPGSLELLDRLHGRVRLGLITNGYSEVQRPRLDHFDLGKYFESITVSSEIGHAKPGAAFFDVAFEQLGHPDRDGVLVVGDSLTSDIAGGAAAGCATCWFNPREQPLPNDEPALRIDHVAMTFDDVASVILGD
jgi:YjjG family noncanonical pyrimidine nucleotidase